MKIRNRFQRGSGVFTCGACGRATRDTGGDNTAIGLCAECYEIGGLENSLEDNGTEWQFAAQTQAEIERLKVSCRSKGDVL